MPSVPVLTPDQAEIWDQRAEAAGIARASLMENAGRSVAAFLVSRYGAAAARGVLVAAGTGNNGGDGWVVARTLHRAGIPVWVTSVAGARSELGEAASRLAISEGVREVPADGPWPQVGIAVDALLGTGARGAPRPAFAALVERLADLRVPVLAVDGPTGVDLATGVVHGNPRADLSMTFGGARTGHLLARDQIGTLVVIDIGHPPPSPDWPTLVDDAFTAARLPRFHADFHKGDRGRVLVVGGAAGMFGAARMVARAAFAGGAGLVHVAGPADTLDVLTTAEPDVQTLLQPFDAELGSACIAAAEGASVVVVGPGLGRGEGRREFVAAVLSHARKAVLDADALTAFHGHVEALADLARTTPMVLTPHPGEFRSLFPDFAVDAETDPWGAAARAAELVGCAVLLKGVPTVIASPDRSPLTVVAGNPGLATGGSGDLLSGLIGALIAGGAEPFEAAAVGAQALGHAAAIAARQHTVRAMRPTDVVAALAEVWREWERLLEAPPHSRLPILLELDAPALA